LRLLWLIESDALIVTPSRYPGQSDSASGAPIALFSVTITFFLSCFRVCQSIDCLVGLVCRSEAVRPIGKDRSLLSNRCGGCCGCCVWDCCCCCTIGAAGVLLTALTASVSWLWESPGLWTGAGPGSRLGSCTSFVLPPQNPPELLPAAASASFVCRGSILICNESSQTWAASSRCNSLYNFRAASDLALR
jgi:hypothetical protein